MKQIYGILSICEDSTSRQAADEFCHELVGRHWERFDIQIHSFMAEDLIKPSIKHKATEAAISADMVVFALSDHPMAERLVAWAEGALIQRCDKEGRLAMLSGARSCRNELILRNLAHRAGIDFITAVPPSLASCLPESPEPYTNQAHEVSELLAEILQRPQPVVPRLPLR